MIAYKLYIIKSPTMKMFIWKYSHQIVLSITINSAILSNKYMIYLAQKGRNKKGKDKKGRNRNGRYGFSPCHADVFGHPVPQGLPRYRTNFSLNLRLIKPHINTRSLELVQLFLGTNKYNSSICTN